MPAPPGLKKPWWGRHSACPRSFYILTRCTVGRWWGRRFRLPTRAGPGPALRRAHQSGRNRVVFYIVYGPLDLTRTTEVTIETLVLPKRLPGSSQDSVAFLAV